MTSKPELELMTEDLHLEMPIFIYLRASRLHMAKCLPVYITHAGEEKEDQSSTIACGRDNTFGAPRTAARDGAEQGGTLCSVKLMNADMSVVSSGKDMSPQDSCVCLMSCQRHVGPHDGKGSSAVVEIQTVVLMNYNNIYLKYLLFY